MLAMTSSDQVRRVLLDADHDLVVEALDDGGALVRDTDVADQPGPAEGFPVSERLARCADLLADAGFAVALVRDERGVYLNAR